MKVLKPIFIVIILGGIAAAAYFLFFKEDTQTAQQAGVRIMEVQKGTLTESAAASGTIEPHTQVEVKSRASGEVIEVVVEEGTSVKTGDLLFRLDPAELERGVERSKISLERLQAQLDSEKQSLSIARIQATNARADKLLDDQGVAEGVTASTSARSSTAAARVAAAQVYQRQHSIRQVEAQIKSAELDIQDAELRLKESRIVAPFDGTVLSVGVEKGSIVSSGITNISGGTALLTLADLSDLRVTGQIDQAQVSKVKAGQDVVIRVDAYADRTFTGKVEKVSPLGTNTSNVVTFAVEIRILDEDKHLLRSGMSADVDIVTQNLNDVILVPLTAINTRDGARYVKMEDGSERKVETGATDGNRIVITEGLQVGEKIQMIGVTRAQAGSGNNRAGGPPGMMPGMGGGRGMGGGGRR